MTTFRIAYMLEERMVFFVFRRKGRNKSNRARLYNENIVVFDHHSPNIQTIFIHYFSFVFISIIYLYIFVNENISFCQFTYQFHLCKYCWIIRRLDKDIYSHTLSYYEYMYVYNRIQV